MVVPSYGRRRLGGWRPGWGVEGRPEAAEPDGFPRSRRWTSRT